MQYSSAEVLLSLNYLSIVKAEYAMLGNLKVKLNLLVFLAKNAFFAQKCG